MVTKRLQWRVQTFTMADANVYDGGCKRLREKAHSFGESDPIRPMSVPRASYSPKEKPWEKTALLPYLVWKSIMRAIAR